MNGKWHHLAELPVLKEYERAMNQTKGLCRNESNKGFVPQ
jgi:hypothetical protein